FAEALKEEVAFVHAEFHGSGRLIRKDVYGSLGGSRRGVEIATIVNLVRDQLTERGKQRAGATVERRLVNGGQPHAEQLHAWRLVYAAALGADHAVLQSVFHPDAIAARDLIGVQHQ